MVTPSFAWEGNLAVFVLIAARVVPVIVWLPAFGGRALPWQLRFGMGGAFAAWFTFAIPPPFAAPVFALVGSAGMGGAAVVVPVFLIGLGEFAIGGALAWLTSLVFVAIEMAGRLTDVARRADAASLLAPLGAEANEEATPMSALYVLLAVLLFAEMGGPGHLVVALVRSYELLPLGGTVVPGLQMGLIPLLARTMGGTVEVTVGLAAPVFVAVWLVDLLFAVAARLAGRDAEVGLMYAGAAPLAGLATMLLALGVLRAGIEGWLLRIPQLLLRTAELWSHG